MDDEELKKKQAVVVAEIAALPEGTTIEEWNRQRFTSDVIRREQQKLRASFFVPQKQRLH